MAKSSLLRRAAPLASTWVAAMRPVNRRMHVDRPLKEQLPRIFSTETVLSTVDAVRWTVGLLRTLLQIPTCLVAILILITLSGCGSVASTVATGYTATLAKRRVYQGCPFSVTLTPTGPAGALFAPGQAFTLTSGNGVSAVVTPPATGGVVSLTMPVSGNQVVAVSSGGAFTNPADPFSVTVLPALRPSTHTGAPPARGDADNTAYGGYLFAQPIQGQRYLIFQAGNTVGFHIPYEVFGVNHRVNLWEVYDFSGTLVDSGGCDVGISTAAKSDTITCANVAQAGAYSLYLYDTTVPAGTVDFVCVQRFVVLNTSLAGLPYPILSAVNEYEYSSGSTFALLSNTAPLTSESSLNGYTPVQSRDCLVRRSFTFTPTSTVTKTLSCNLARITVNGQVVQPFHQFPAYQTNNDRYSNVSLTLTAGTSYAVTVENFLTPDPGAASFGGWTLPSVQFSDGTALNGIQSQAGTPGEVSISDYLAYLTTGGGDNNDTIIRGCLGEAGSLIRYPVSNTSQASDFAAAIVEENGLVLGARDAARERRRVIFNFVDLLTVQQQVDAGTATLQTYSSSGITAFISGLIAEGLNPADFVVEGANEPQGATPAYYGPIMARLYDAVKAANSGVQVVGASSVAIDAANLSFQQQAIAASGNKIDGVSAHIYNAIVGDYGDGKVSFDALAAWLNANGLDQLPFWQTEQGAEYPYHGAVYIRYSPRLVLAQKLLLERYGIPAARDLYWAPSNSWSADPTGYMRSNFNTWVIYPEFIALRTWGDEIFGLTYSAPVEFGSDWDKQLWGNTYTGKGGGMMALTTNGASSFSLPVSVSTGVSSLAARTWDGKDLTIPVSGGTAVLPLDDMMLYVRVPTGVTITPALPTLGPDLALGATVSANSSTVGSLSLLNDGITTGSTRVPVFGPLLQITTPTSQQDDEVVMDFGAVTTFNQVQISCPFPFQGDGTLLDFVVQSWDGVNWNTIQSVTQTVEGVPVPSLLEGSRLDDYSNRANLFLLSFAPISSSKVRLLIYSASYGVSPTSAMAAYGSVDTPTTNQPTLREIGIYNATYAADPIPPAGDDLDDPGGYGIVNLLRYALNLDPQTPNIAGLPALSATTEDGATSLALTYTKVKAATDLVYIVEVSDDLVNWSSGGGYTEDINVVDEGTTEQVTTLDVSATSPTAPPSQFMRLRVTRQ